MAQQTVIGVFDSYSDAQQAAQAVIAAGVSRDNVRISPQSSASGGTTTSANTDDKGFWSGLKDALGFGDDDNDQYGYREATRRGGSIVTVEADERKSDQIVEILQRYKAVNLDERASQWREQGWTGAYHQTSADQATTSVKATAGAASQPQAQQRTAAHATQAAGEKLEVVEEQLQVGKRAVAKGGIRIHQRVTERPVEEKVALREEHVTLDRKPVDRPVTTADEAFHNRTIEATAMAEQAVVAKEARVVEEVTLHKDVQQRTETVRDTVKRQDVEVEQIPASGQVTDERFRPVYAFADELSQDQRYKGREWTTVETDARRSFEQRHPNSKWDEFKDAIRTRYERSKSSMRD